MLKFNRTFMANLFQSNEYSNEYRKYMIILSYKIDNLQFTKIQHKYQ